MRRQDHRFNARLTLMRKNIEEVNSACWYQKLCRLQPYEAGSVEETSDHTLNLPESVLSDEYLPVRSNSSDAVHKRRSNKPELRLDISNHSALPAMHDDDVGSSSIESSPVPRYRNSFGSVYERDFHKQTSVRSLPASPVPRHSGGLKPTTNNATSQRRGSLGTWLMKKIQHH
jgi:hypothetical protein